MQHILDGLIPEPLSYLRGTLRFDAGGSETVSCRDLCDPQHFDAVIGRYAVRFPDTDRRAAVSVWTMYYFSHLVVSPLLFWLVDRRVLALGAGDLTARFDPETILPAGFVLQDAGRADASASVFDAMESAIRGHAEPLVRTISAQTGVSPKLLWSNVAVYADWVIREVGASMPERRDAALALLENNNWPDGSPNPLAGWIRQETGPDGACFSQRRVCCLRYLLPGVPGCGMICPIPAGRD
jgi:ferric iron reductase protein FhuF